MNKYDLDLTAFGTPAALVEESELGVQPAERKEPQHYMPMYHGKATDALATMNSRQGEIDAITQNKVIVSGGVKLVIQRFNDLKTTLGVNTHKLLSIGVASFTALNNYDRQGGKNLQYRVTFPLKEYAASLGYDVYEKTTDNEADAEKERKRAKSALDNARKAIRKDGESLQAFTLTWEEDVKGKSGDFDRVSILSRFSIKNGVVLMEFGVSMAEYLSMLPITQYPIPLLSVDGRNSNAYSMGLQMWEHYNNDNNLRAGTANRLRVSTLLKYTSLPQYEDVMKTDRHWDRRIKEPFESALESLVKAKVIADWKYTYTKGVDLEDEVAENITDYKTFSELYITFVLNDAPDHSERLKARAIEAKSRSTRRTRKG